MIIQSDKALEAWRATERVLDAIVTINGTGYHTTDITSIAYDSGAFTGDTFAIGSTYENGLTIEFSHIVEGLEQGQKVTAKVGIKTSDGTYEYCSLGVFIVSDDIEMDRNNDLTTIKCYDQMCLLEGTYTSKLSYPASAADIIAEIANMAGVTLNTDEIARLPTVTSLPNAISGQTYREAIGWIAQFYAGFATFDRDGKLTIRTIATPDYALDPSQYEQAGLTKNEAPYKIGGIQCEVTTTTTDSTGESTDNTVTLQVGDTTGSQIKLTNNLMTQERLEMVWNQLKDINFYPYSLNWFGNPAIEAGDWLTLQDTKGNKFNVPNNSYTMAFDGSFSAVSKADQTSTSSSTYAWNGQLTQVVKTLVGKLTPAGNFIYGPETTDEPTGAKFNDLWYKQNGNKLEMWTYERQNDGSGKWTQTVSDATGEEVKSAVSVAQAEADVAKQKAEDAVSQVNIANQKYNEINTDVQLAKSNAANALSQVMQAQQDATSALSVANGNNDKIVTLQSNYDDLSGQMSLKAKQIDVDSLDKRVTTTEANISANTQQIALSAKKTDVDQLASRVSTAESNISVMAGQIQTKVTQNDINNTLTGYATQDWTNGQITVKANEINSTVSNVQTEVNGLQIGGRNMIPSSKMDNITNNGWSYDDNIWVEGTGTVINSLGSDKSRDIGREIYGLFPNTDYSISIDVDWGEYDSDIISSFNAYVFFVEHKSDGTNTAQYVDNRYVIQNSDPRQGFTFRTQWDTYRGFLIVRADPHVKIQFKELALQIGNKWGPWSPAPEDMATNVALTEVKQTADGLLSTVSNIQGIKADISYVDQTATMISGKVGYDNLIANPEFTGAGNQYIPGWTINANTALPATATWDTVNGSAAYQIIVKQDDANQWYQACLASKMIAAAPGQIYSAGAHVVKWDGQNNDLSLQMEFFASDMNTRTGFNVLATIPYNENKQYVGENVTAPDNTAYVRLTMFSHGSNSFTTARWQLSRSTTLPYYSTAGTGSFSILNDNINLRVEKNGVINAVNISSEGIQIYGDKLHITASTYIDNAVIKSAMIDSLSADKITVGTLNGASVNVINLNAANITTGTLSGSNLSLNLDTGEVLFQKGAIKSTDGLLDIEINDGTFSQNNSNGDGFIFRNGNIYFSNKSSWAAWDAPLYGTISLNERAFAAGQGGMAIKGAKNVVVQTDDYNGDFVMGPPASLTGSGLLLREDRIEMASAQTYLYGGLGYSYINHPFIEIGTSIWENQYNDNAGSNVLIRASGIILDGNVMSLNGFHIANNYITTAGDGLWVNSAFGSGGNAAIHAQSFNQTSLLSKKTNVIPLDRLKARNAIRTVDIQEYMYKDDVENGITKKYSSGIIDDINDKPKYSMPFDWISADGKGREDGTALGYTIVAVQDLYDQIEDLKEQVKQLKGESAA